MSRTPHELRLEIEPRSRFDAIDIGARVSALHGDVLDGFRRRLYYSFHTTAGYLGPGLAGRLAVKRQAVAGYLGMFRAVFPEGASYRHDALELRSELSDAQRLVEPKNADSHLAYMAAGLRSCVRYPHVAGASVPFIDLDGVVNGRPRTRQASVVGYDHEIEVARTQLTVPVSGHPIDSINLRAPELGLASRVAQLAHQHGVTKGCVRLELASSERQAALTVNEYETLLMQHDLRDVLRDPLRFLAEKGRHALEDPRAIPTKTMGYATYDLVQALNQLVDALNLEESLLARLLGRIMALPAERLFRMKRSVHLLVSDHETPGDAAMVQGHYQSPILIQWGRAPGRARRIELTLSRFV
jgi:hypothetical protein